MDKIKSRPIEYPFLLMPCLVFHVDFKKNYTERDAVKSVLSKTKRKANNHVTALQTKIMSVGLSVEAKG